MQQHGNAVTVMWMDERLDEFGELFAEFVRRSLDAKSREEPAFRTAVRAHLGIEPAELPVLAEEVPDWDHANLQLALEAMLAGEGRTAELVGIAGGRKRYMALSLSDLVNEHEYEPGSIEYENVPVGPGQTHPCMLFGLVLLRDRGRPAVC
jgi:cell division protease FtsH